MFKQGIVTVLVSDLERAVTFYNKTLGLELKQHVDGHWAEVQLPGLIIGLHPQGAEGPRAGKSESLSIGFEVDDFGEAVAELQRRGLYFNNKTEDKATHLAEFTDPDGNPLYIVQVKAGARE